MSAPTRQRRIHAATQPPPLEEIELVVVDYPVTAEEMANHPLVIAFDRMLRNPIKKGDQ